MKPFQYFRVILAIVFVFSKSSDCSESDELNSVVFEIITKVYAKEASAVNIIRSSEGSNIYSQKGTMNNDMVHELITKVFNTESILLSTESIKNIQHAMSQPRTCVAIFIDSFSDFQIIYDKLSPVTFNFYGLFTITLTNGKINGIADMFRLLWSKRISNVVIIYYDRSAVKVSTFFPFNSKSCNDTTAVDISHDAVEDFFPEKTKDLKNCPIVVGAPQLKPFIMFKNNEIVGRDIELAKAIAQALNFKLQLSFLNYSQSYGILYDNGSATGAIKDLMDSKSDMIVGDYFLKFGRLVYLDSSKSYCKATLHRNSMGYF